MRRALTRTGIWLGSFSGGVAMIVGGLYPPAPDWLPVALGSLLAVGVLLAAVGVLGLASEIVGFVNSQLVARQQPF